MFRGLSHYPKASYILKYLGAFIIISLSLQASMKDITSYQASFEQTIIDQDNVKIVYTGTFQALKPRQALWQYKTPVEKRVYINNQQVVIVEPELEQAIFKYTNNNFSLFNILDDAKKIDTTTYEKTINERIYRLKIKDNKILRLDYLDDFENRVSIAFSKQKPNIALQSKNFHPIISEEYDIIKE